MTFHKTLESFMEEICSAVLESCCRVVIIPLCEDNIRRLTDRLKSEHEHIMRATNLSQREVFIWMKKIGNLKKRSESFLATHESRTGFCRFISFPFDNYIAATLVQDWEKLDEEEPNGVLLPPDSSNARISRNSTAPIGAIEAELSNYDHPNGNDSFNRDVKRVETDGNCDMNNLLVLNSVSFRGEGDQVARDLLSTLRIAGAGNSATALVQSSRGIRLTRSQSFEIIHDERWIVLDRRFL